MKDKITSEKFSGRLLELDALRGIACITVLAFHYTMLREDVPRVFRFGITGVDLFFMISGFVILMSLEKTRDWKDFVVGRFSRLFPAYWACLVITGCLLVLNDENLGHITHLFIGNVFMIQHYFHIEDMDGPYWSLLIELLFYFLMIIIFVTKTVKKIELIGFAFLILEALYHFVLKPFVPEIFNAANNIVPLFNHFPLFFAGIIFYRMKTDRQSILRYLLLIACFVLAIFLFEDGGKSKGSITQMEYLVMISVYFIFFVLYLNNMLFFIVNRLTLYLGTISYSLYLIHQYIGIHVIIPRLEESTNWNYYLIAFGVALPCAVLIASIVTFLIEKPAMRYLRSRLRRKAESHITI